MTNVHLTISWYQPIQHLPKLIDLRRLERISLRLISHRGNEEALLHQLSLVFQNASNVHSLDISRYGRYANYDLTLRGLAERIPLNIRHIQVEVTFMEEMKVIVKEVPHLYSLTFRWCTWRQRTVYGEFQNWLKEKGIDYLSQVDQRKISFLVRRKIERSGRVLCSQQTSPKGRGANRKRIDGRVESDYGSDLDTFLAHLDSTLRLINNREK